MMDNKNTNKLFLIFLFSHLFLWTLSPSLTNVNLPLDTIEALAWGSDLKWGFNKHPPLSAFITEVFYQIFGTQDWAYYLLSQLFVVTAFYFVFKFANQILDDVKLAFISVLILEGIYFYNFTTPEFNVNIAQLPFWALSIFYTWKCLKQKKIQDYLLLGIIFGLGILSKYLFLYLVISIKLLFIYLIFKNKIKLKNTILAGTVTLLIISPHLIWLFENNFVTLIYGFSRTGGNENFLDHIIYPSIFLFKQIGILLPFFILIFFLIKKFNLKKNLFNEKSIFLYFTCLVPIILMLLTSLIMGVKIRTMWMTPFYLILGVLVLYILKIKINFRKIKKFYYVFFIIFFLSPISYSLVSLSNDFKRTDYPGKEIARLVQNRWDKNFSNEIKIVVGDEWYAGNLSYHLTSRPKWVIDLTDKTRMIKSKDGVIYTGNPKILKKVCPGIFGTIKPVGYCMIGK